jgi:COX assembly protein 1
MIYACRQPRLAMNSCMLQYQNQDELDKARLEWFALAEERRQVCYFNNEQTNILRKLEDGRVGAIS